MRNLNKVVLMGHTTEEADVRYTQNGTLVVSLRLATNEVWFDEQNDKHETVDYHKLVLFSPKDERAKTLHKGIALYVEGKNRTRKYTDAKDGSERYVTEVVVKHWHEVVKPPKAEEGEPSDDDLVYEDEDAFRYAEASGR